MVQPTVAYVEVDGSLTSPLQFPPPRWPMYELVALCWKLPLPLTRLEQVERQNQKLRLPSDVVATLSGRLATWK